MKNQRVKNSLGCHFYYLCVRKGESAARLAPHVKAHKIRVPFGIEILCCLPYIIMVNIVAGLAWETRDRNSTEVACESFTGEILRPTDGAVAKSL